MAINAKIKATREQRGLRQSDVIDEMRRQGYVWHAAKASQVESGVWLLSYAELRALARYLDVEPQDLYPQELIGLLRDAPHSLAAI